MVWCISHRHRSMDIPVLTSNSGIYAIVCLPTGKRYIGSSKILRARLLSHRSDLRRNAHDSRHLQNAWNLYGADQFVIEIIEYCEIEQLLDREQHYLDTIRPYDHTVGFNGRSIAAGGHSFIHSDEAMAKIRAYLAASRERRVAKAISTQGKPFRLKSPTGEIHEGIGIRSFARQQGLNEENLKDLVRGKIKWVKGWTLPEINLPSYVFEAPDGQKHTVTYMGFSSFCRIHGLCAASMRKVRNGLVVAHKGWHLPQSPNIPITLIDPSGKEITTNTTNLGLFAAKHSLRMCNLSALVKGTDAQYHGWTVK